MEQTAREELGNFKIRNQPLERDKRFSTATRESPYQEQPARKDIENVEERAHRSKETAELENKEQTARKKLENFRTRSKTLERDREFERGKRNRKQGANRSKGTRTRRMSEIFEKD